MSYSAAEILELMSKVPNNPTDALFSRRAHPQAPIKGDAIVFPLEPATVNPANFVDTIKQAQENLYQIIERDLNLTDKTWVDKELRHAEKSYKHLKKLHLAFAGSVPPSAASVYDEFIKQRHPAIPERVTILLREILSANFTGVVKEVKLNSDGHIVVRVTINPQDQFLEFRNRLIFDILGTSGLRYTDPEKATTLASVIFLVDFHKLTLSAKSIIQQRLFKLETDLKAQGNISFTTIEWVEYRKRTLSENSRITTRIITNSDIKIFVSDELEAP